MCGAYDRICHGDLQLTRNHFEMFPSLSFFIVRALKIKVKERLFLVPDPDLFKLAGLYSYAAAHLH